MGFESFTFRRADGTIHRFRLAGDGSWIREDGQVRCVATPDGWCVVDTQGNEVGWPVGPRHAIDRPPAGRWRSGQAGRSYAYEMSYEATS